MREQFRQQMHELSDTLVLQAQAAAKATACRRLTQRYQPRPRRSVIDADHCIDMLERNIDELGTSSSPAKRPWPAICVRSSQRYGYRPPSNG